MSLSAATRQAIVAEMAAAPHGTRADTARRLATTYGCSVATVYRHADRRGARRQRESARPEYRDWVRRAVQLAHRAPKPVPLDLAIEGAIEMGLIPAAAAAMPLATAQRVRRELGLVRTSKRTHRLHADYPMQALLVDGSTSQYLTVAGRLDDDDYQLRLHRAPYPAGGYKNKPLGADRLRVLVYGVWDMCTGYVLSRYCVGTGETALAQMEFLAWVFAKKTDPRLVMHGLPDDLWSDLGPFYRSQPVRDLCEALEDIRAADDCLRQGAHGGRRAAAPHALVAPGACAFPARRGDDRALRAERSAH